MSQQHPDDRPSATTAHHITDDACAIIDAVRAGDINRAWARYNQLTNTLQTTGTEQYALPLMLTLNHYLTLAETTARPKPAPPTPHKPPPEDAHQLTLPDTQQLPTPQPYDPPIRHTKHSH